MKYISFLGNWNYTPVKYEFDEVLTETYFQNIILNIHKNDKIDGLIVVTTKEGNEKHYASMCEGIKNKYPELLIKNVIVKDGDNYEALIKEILNYLKEDLSKEDIILDVTHCFRTMPTKILLTLDYLEKNINVKVKHLYYGKVDPNTSTGEVIDFIKFYNESKVAESLRQFKATLKLSNVDTIYEDNKDLKALLREMQSLNDYLELADYENTKDCMIKISKYSKKLMDNEDMKRVKIYLKTIYNTFAQFDENTDDFNILRAIVNLLNKHHYYQLACTFVYKKYEAWIHHYLGVEHRDNGNFFRWLGRIIKQFEELGLEKYKASVEEKEYHQSLLNQIIDYYNNESYKICDYIDLSEEDDLSLMPYLIYESYVCIEDFANKIRNPLNHANTLRANHTQLGTEFEKMLDSIQRLYKVGAQYDF